jgi:hypothetical protein
MANSKRSKEGYLMIDNRAAYMPVPDKDLHENNLPPEAGRGLFETSTYTCSHCESIVVMNPMRTREREYCRGCDSYICDGCGYEKKQGKPCKTMKQIIDEAMNLVEKNSGLIIL